MRATILVWLVGLAPLVWVSLAVAGPTTARAMIARERTLIIGHRGASADYPENTLPSFQAAIDAGADLVELDYHHSSDGVPIVIHDETLDRTTDALARWGGKDVAVADRPARELVTLDAGLWKGERHRGARLPTLVEALELIQNKCMTLIERKEGNAATCVRLLRERNLVDRVVVQAFDWDYLADCHCLAPDLILGALGEGAMTPARLEEARRVGARVVGWNHKDVSPAAIARAREMDLAVWTYTVNSAERASALMAIGVRGIITDRPAEIERALAK